MCKIDNGDWNEHKKLVYHKIDANTRVQNAILKRIRAMEKSTAGDAEKRGRFEARMDEKMSRVEKIVYGAIATGVSALVVQIAAFVVANGGP